MVNRRELIALVVAACGSPAAAPREATTRAPIETWTIAGHALATTSSLTDGDAEALYGRTVEIRGASYTTPWHGHCEDAGRSRRARVLADVLVDLAVPASGREAAQRFGIADELVEVQLTCTSSRTPPVTVYLAGERAFTCFGGVCYFLRP